MVTNFQTEIDGKVSAHANAVHVARVPEGASASLALHLHRHRITPKMMLRNRPLNLLSTIKRCHYSRSSLLPTVLSASNLFITSSPAGRDSSQSDVRVASRTSTGELTDDERVVPFYLFQTGRHSRKPSPPVGFVRSEVVDAMRTMHKEAGNASPWKWTTAIQSHSGEEEVHGVSFSNAVDRKGHSGRTEALNALLVQWKKAKLFKDILRGIVIQRSLCACG
jgi:hypothetical protein